MPIDFTLYKGLTEEKAKAQQNKYGLNVLTQKKKRGLFYYVSKITQEPMLLILLIAAVLYFIIGSTWDGVLMIGGALMMIGIDLYQERKTDKALEMLSELSTPKVSVIRNSKTEIIPRAELTVGDLMLLKEGERVAGDGIIVSASNLFMDESLLTGESGSVYKTARKSETDKQKDVNHVFMGTLVLSGQAVIEVKAIGNKTQFGKIGQSLATIEEEPTPLQKQTKKLVKIFGIAGLLSCLLLMLIVFEHNHQIIDSFLKGLTLTISVIPEEMPVILTVFGALGAYRLTRKKTLVRKISAVETLGHITTLCTDKTGTLTENRMELEELYAGDKLLTIREVKKANHALFPFLTNALLASQPNPYDPMDLSIHKLAKKIGLLPKTVYQDKNLIEEYGFDQKLKFMGHLWRAGDKQILAVKGSAEAVIEKCSLNKLQKETLLKQIDTMASKGLRVLAAAQKELNAKNFPKTLNDLVDFDFVALLGFRDPPRADAKKTIALCRRAGISVRMITGDHPQTAFQIAKAVGLKVKGGVITGAELDNLTEDELTKKIKDVHIFARIQPEQKLKITRALKKLGHVVAMIGDGVNDAPSLKDADIGIAMGERGTNVAREASDVILLDDRLMTVVGAVHDGRKIFDNIKKAFSYIFTVHTYVILTALFVPLIGLPILLTPIHIVLLELLIDPTCALVFEAIPAESDIMQRKPRNPQKPLLSGKRLIKVFSFGIGVFIISFGAFLTILHYTGDQVMARTVSFSAMLWSNLFLVLTFVHERKSIFNSLKFFTNKTFLSVYAIMAIVLVILIYTPKINLHFDFEAIPLWLFALSISLGFIPTGIGEIYKMMTSKL